MPCFSIVTPLFNSEKFISRAIDSVLSQTLSDWEMIIVDDCSKDESVIIVNSYVQADPRIKLIEMPNNSGPAAARNIAIKSAIGRYIAFLDSDDVWYPEKLESQLNFIEEKKAGLVFSAYKKRFDDGSSQIVDVPDEVTYDDLLKCCVIGCLTAVYDTRIFGKVFMPDIRKRQDFCLWLDLLKKTDCAYGQKNILAEYSARDDSISSNKRLAAAYQWKVYREIEKFNYAKSMYFFLNYAVRGVFRNKIGRFKLF
tara:strand:+ start:2461 stop:3222 length:762 start_codon:yes stop_codon:yes gene_type:complete